MTPADPVETHQDGLMCQAETRDECDLDAHWVTTAPTPPECANHREVQHRDGKPPWCNTCGWTHGRPAMPPRQIRALTTEDDQ